MTPKELLDLGRLDEAVETLTGEVKAHPSDTSLRVFLFELLSLSGDLERAARHLEVIALQGDVVTNSIAVQVYRQLLTAEHVRRQVFHGEALPKFVLTPPAYLDNYVVLLKTLARRTKDVASAAAAAEDGLPDISGRFGEREFSTIRDADDRVAPVIEVFHGADYLWLPIEQVTRLRVTRPRNLRDLVWTHATVETYESSVGDVFVPALYVDTHAHTDNQVRLGRMTAWEAVDDAIVCGAGLRTFLVDDEEVSLFDLQNLEIAATAPPTAEEA